MFLYSKSEDFTDSIFFYLVCRKIAAKHLYEKKIYAEILKIL